MNSSELAYRGYTIKTFESDGMCRARAFRKGAWLREVSDWTADSVEDAVQRMRASLDALEDDLNAPGDEMPSYAQPFCKLWSPPAVARDPQGR